MGLIIDNRKLINLFETVHSMYKNDPANPENKKLGEEVLANIYAGIRIHKIRSDEDYISEIFIKLNRRTDYTLDAMAAVTIENGVPTLIVNPMIMLLLCESIQDIVSVIHHEILHVIFKHIIIKREKGLNHHVANIAQDILVNQYIPHFSNNLKNVGWNLDKLKEILNDPNIKSKENWEYYYSLIPGEYHKNPLEDLKDLLEKIKETTDEEKRKELLKELYDRITGVTISNDLNTVSNNSIELDESDISILRELLKESLPKMRGTAPSDIVSFIETQWIREPIIRWQDVALRGIRGIPAGKKYTFQRQNRRLRDRKDLPGVITSKKAIVYVAVDTSGSVADVQQQFIFNELYHILKGVNALVYVIHCDSRVNSVKKYNSVKGLSSYKVVGRGGTSFTPVFEYISENVKNSEYPDMVIYMTDGYGESHIDEKYALKKGTKLLWVLTGNSEDALSLRPSDNKCFVNNGNVLLLNIEGKKYKGE